MPQPDRTAYGQDLVALPQGMFAGMGWSDRVNHTVWRAIRARSWLLLTWR